QNHPPARIVEDDAEAPEEAATDVTGLVGLGNFADIDEPSDRAIKGRATQLKLREPAHRYVYRSAHSPAAYRDGFADRFTEFVLLDKSFGEQQRIGRAGVNHELPFEGLAPGSGDFGFHVELTTLDTNWDTFAGAVILVSARLV